MFCNLNLFREALRERYLTSKNNPRHDRLKGKYSVTYLTLCLFYFSPVFVSAQEAPAEPNLDEDFLIYLADMSMAEGRIIDQLDMLNIENETIEENIDESPAKTHKKSVKVKYQEFGSDAKEEQQ